jgi:pyruvyltransferase
MIDSFAYIAERCRESKGCREGKRSREGERPREPHNIDRSVKVYWSKCGHGNGNFGDSITPMLLKHIGVPVEWAAPEHAELIGAGSVLEKVRETFRGVIWTTGFMHGSSRSSLRAARVLAVRGRHTLDRLMCPNHDSVVLGDAGLLCSEIAPGIPARKTQKLGIIPHFVDVEDPCVKALAGRSPEIVLIDICADPANIMRAAAQCEYILSSSLHGLILADSLGIPNLWLELNRGAEHVAGEGYKYRDYYSVFGITPAPLRIDHSTTLDDAIAAIEASNTRRPGLEQIQGALRETVRQISELVRPASEAEIAEKRDSQADWWRRRSRLHQVIAEVIPSGTNVIVADEEQIRPSITGVRALPFVERQGQYWGPPGSAEEAIAETQRQAARGAHWMIIAWPMLWLLETFPAFSRHLDEHYHIRHESEIGRILERRNNAPRKTGAR